MSDDKMEENGDVNVDLTPEERDILVMSYIDNHFLEVSKSKFADALKSSNIKNALYDAVLNEIANEILTKQMTIANEENEKIT